MAQSISGIVSFPDFSPRSFDSSVSPDTARILSEFKPQYDITVHPDQYVPKTAETLLESQAARSRMIMQQIREYIDEKDSWENKLLPREIATTPVMTWVTMSTDPALMQRAPENLVPQLLEIRKSRHAVRLAHYQQGFSLNHQNFLTPEGKVEYRLKVNNLAQNVSLTMRYLVKSAVIECEDYYSIYSAEYETPKTMRSIAEARADEIRTAGMLNKDEKALWKIPQEFDRDTETKHIKPDMDMLVISNAMKACATWLGQYATEACRAGEARVERILGGSNDEIARIFKLGVYVNSHEMPTNVHGYANPLSRQNSYGQVAMLESTMDGPRTHTGHRVPATQIKDIGHDNWTTVNALDALDNDVRFDATGSMAPFIRRVLAKREAIQSKWQGLARDFTYADPWIMRFGDYYEIAQYFGDQELIHRSTAADIETARRAAAILAVDAEDIRVIDQLRQAADECFYATPGSYSSVSAQFLLDATNGDTTHGGSIFASETVIATRTDPTHAATVLAAGEAPQPKPYGACGDIIGVVSVFSQLGDAVPRIWPKWNAVQGLTYSRILTAIERVVSRIERVFPETAVNSPDECPPHRLTSNPETNRRNAIIYALIEGRIKYPAWWKTRGAAVAIFGAAAKNSFDNAQHATVEAVFKLGASRFLAEMHNHATPQELFNEVSEGLKAMSIVDDKNEAIWKAAEDPFEKVVAAIIDLGNDDEQKRYGVGAAIDGVAKMARQIKPRKEHSGSNWIEPKITFAEIKAMYEYGKGAYDGLGGRGVNQNAEITYLLTRAVLSKDSFNTGSDTIMPTDPKAPWRPLVPAAGGAAGRQAAVVNARAPYPALQPEQREAHNARHTGGSAYRDVTAATVVSEFATDKRQVFGQMAQNAHGPFLAVHVMENNNAQVKAKRTMHKRATDLANELAHDAMARMAGLAFLFSRVSRASVRALFEFGVMAPFNFLIAHPFVQIRADAILIAKSGIETGRLGFNYGDMLMGLSTDHKQHLANLTVWMAAAITTPHNIYIKPDVMFTGYIGGKDLRYFKSKEQFARVKSVKDINETPSALVFSVPGEFTRSEMLHNNMNPICLFGKANQNTFGRQKFAPGVLDQPLPPFPGWVGYNEMLNFAHVNSGRSYDPKNFRMRQRKYVLGEMYLEDQRTWNSATNRWEWTVDGTGHLDGFQVPGMKARLDGMIPYNSELRSGKM